ncbi:MAG TPA: AbrB/MazE/SpoVT family DNA-binding domain-containing protein [Alphaproteobacteria bacterium]|nr:AbrB/MazE/SpoVT family DNA-binding domain-containing protein [Alphaproteobacteria bacterium]
MDIAITKMSSKGQIVIPQEMRKDLKEGDKLLVIKQKDQLILKKVAADSKLLKDIERARRADAAVERYEQGKGKYITMSFEEFMEEARKW